MSDYFIYVNLTYTHCILFYQFYPDFSSLSEVELKVVLIAVIGEGDICLAYTALVRVIERHFN